jgi:hypothetical protein
VLGCAHEQKAHGLQWVGSIGVANTNVAFAMLVGLYSEARFWTTSADLLYLLIAQMPRCPDLSIFGVTDRQIKPIALPLAHARGVIISL